MRRRVLTLLLPSCGGLAFLAATAPPAQVRTRPNVLFIMSDDGTTQANGATGDPLWRTADD